MRWTITALILGVLAVPAASIAQSEPPTVSATVPRLIQVTGVFQPADGQAASAVEVVTVSIYAEPDGALPVWQERQSVAVENTTGRFTLLLGASYPDGIPAEVFGAGQAQWMSLLFERAGEREQARVRIASVPYALKASDAETLGGLPASAYLRAPTGDAASVASTESSATSMPGPTPEAAVLPGTTNYLAKYVNGVDVGNSAVYETPTALVPTGAVGIGTTAPADVLHLRFNSPDGQLTGLAVQNIANTPTAYSGMLFFDHTGALKQFQGYNNQTGEYRINNIASNASINFMMGASSRFFIATNGNVGIGTNLPSATLEVSNVVQGTANGNMAISTFGNTTFGSAFFGRKARGTTATPAPVQSGDLLATFGGRGYGTTAFGGDTGAIRVVATETWTDTARGTRLGFVTTANTTNAPTVRMVLDPNGRLGLGTNSPSSVVEVLKEGNNADFLATSYEAAGSGADSAFITRYARGTAAAPSAVQLGDELGFFAVNGRGATGWGDFAGGLVGLAGENWTDTAQGAAVFLAATPLGSTQAEGNLVVLPGGNVGIGAFNDFPTITDRLHVFGDIRMGTTGANGCLRNFAGTGLIGTCVSDRRYKKDVTPFSPVLSKLAGLQPVHYFWRAEDFPQQRFGDSRAYGLIAQEVEDILPELVVTNEDGFKAVDYTKLPLLTIQAVKELKAENDALKVRVAENDVLRARVDELERLVKEILAAASPR